jgi:hypothetical protein
MDTTPTDIDQATEAPEPATEQPIEAPIDDQGATFPAETVRELRDELAKRRVRSKEQSAAANARLLGAYVAADGRLIDAEMLSVSDDLMGDDGLLDQAKVSEAIDTLIAAKPYLSARKPTTPIVQGVQPQVPEAAGLLTLIRERM